ncbi:MAG: PAS domain-containing sensor histidine kinase [Alphaproteobacteria bacterium]
MTAEERQFDFSALFKMMPIPRLIVNVKDGEASHVVQVNDLALKYLDLPYDKVCGYKIPEFMDAENARHFDQSFKVAISRKRTVTIQALPTIPGGLKVYGFWVSPVVDDSGNVLYLDVLGQLDIRDQSILQRERDDAISLLASIFEVSEVGIIVTDELAKIVRVNDSFLRTYGWSRHEMIGLDFAELVTEDERERVRVNHKKFVSVGGRTTGEVKVLRKNSGVANVLFTSATLRLSQNRKFLVTTIMDITLRKQMEESLRLAKKQADTANRSKSTFLANMSHELRTPLNAIIGFSELMIKKTFGSVENDKYQEYLEDIHMSAEHLLEIINEVLDMSKIEAGRLDLIEEPVDVRDTIDSVVRMLSSRVFSSDIEIVQDVRPEVHMILADYRLIRQVLINLVTNAIKFSAKGTAITIRAYLDEGSGDLILSVVDQGKGIEKAKISRALEPFGQVSDTPDHRDVYNQGTGLGLPLAKAMINMHGGQFLLESEVGIGTTVTVTLPKYRILKKDT